MSTALKSTVPQIDSVNVYTYTVPTDFPESDGTIEWSSTTIVIVEARANSAIGIGYTYANQSAGQLIRDLLSKTVEDRNAMDVAGSWNAMVQSVRNLGRPGLCSMAISAVDIALWDLKAKLLDLPLVKLLGAVRNGIPVYGSGGFTSYSIEQLQRQLSGWTSSGIRMVKMKIGRNPERDPDRVRSAREAIGKEAQLFVDANGAYTRKQALRLSQRFAEDNVCWFEEPVSSDDLEGLCLMRDRAPACMDIAAGEYGYDANYFRRMLESGAVDVLQADATRCGGITGFMQADALCVARSMPLSAHTAPSIHMHACCASTTAVHLEYFHDHVRIEKMFFDGAREPSNGELVPDLTRPGLGIELRRRDMEQYAAH
ncbi:MAG TPA: enolase C-terminal domain-like protein [Candidatus Acidoferrales bacterium]|nr:enolase C-terminal domain-like protein [Candidatus Acidoferrales bacterium]